MMISTKGRYALRVMLDLAQYDGEYVSLKEIATRQEVSLKYLEMIVAMLHKAGLVRSMRGKEGGYRLAQPPGRIAIGSILRLTEGGLAPVSCLKQGTEPCPRAEGCPTLPLWKELHAVVNHYLDGVTLQDMLTGAIPAGTPGTATPE